jgi:hypothetical protein
MNPGKDRFFLLCVAGRPEGGIKTEAGWTTAFKKWKH